MRYAGRREKSKRRGHYEPYRPDGCCRRLLLASGTSERHVRTIADNIETGMKERGVRPYSVEGYREGRWVIIDYQNTIAHIFLEQLRDLYDLESLWIEAKRYRIETKKSTQRWKMKKKERAALHPKEAVEDEEGIY